MRPSPLLSLPRSPFDPDVHDQLWAEIPAEFRLSRYRYDTIPLRWATSFSLRPPTKARDTADCVDTQRLPEVMQHEIAYAIWHRVALQGGALFSYAGGLTNRLADLVDQERQRGGELVSLMDLSRDEWERRLRKLQLSRGLTRGGATRYIAIFRPWLDVLSLRYDPGEWWRRDVWSAQLDRRIPVREHEPRLNHVVNFLFIATPWLREGAKWHLKTSLETHALAWTSVFARQAAMRPFDRFVSERKITSPALADGADGPRRVMLDFMAWQAARPVDSGPKKGGRRSDVTVAHTVTHIEQFYAAMAAEREAAALAAGRAWLDIDQRHIRLFRFGEKPRHAAGAKSEASVAEQIIEEGPLSVVLDNAELLARPKAEGGFGDPQVMRILLLMALTGRRIHEILMLDFDPLLPLSWASGNNQASEWFVARLRYQLTKVRTGSSTIPVETEVVNVVREQQAWAMEFMRTAAGSASPEPPRYLFLARNRNRLGDRFYPEGSLHRKLSDYVRAIDVRDSTGRLVDISRTHRFRHTRATTLINRGVALPVLMRYMGHVTPTMTMHYSHIAARTEEEAFVRFEKVTSDGRPLEIPARDLYDMLQLIQSADRILPNGFCLLPPRQACDRGNACLTCNKYATDGSHLDAHHDHLDETRRLVGQRKTEFRARNGTDMPEENVWLQGRLAEMAALEAVIGGLSRLGSDCAARGLGANAGPQPVTLAATRHRSNP